MTTFPSEAPRPQKDIAKSRLLRSVDMTKVASVNP